MPEAPDPGNLPLQQLLRQHAETLLARLPSASLSARVIGQLGEQLAHGEPDRAELARKLNLSERTLQRRLAEEGCSYPQLLADTRRQLAEQHLRDGRLPATEIALLLGYSEPSVFFRAFRQWTGLTPGEYRTQHGAGSLANTAIRGPCGPSWPGRPRREQPATVSAHHLRR